MNSTENTIDRTGDHNIARETGVCNRRWSAIRHLSCANVENPYGIAAVIPVMRTNVVKNGAPFEPT